VGARDGVPEYLSTHDRQSPLFADYIRTYDEIASDDLATSMQPKALLERKSASIIELLGPLNPGTRVCDVGVGQGEIDPLGVLEGGDVQVGRLPPDFAGSR